MLLLGHQLAVLMSFTRWDGRVKDGSQGRVQSKYTVRPRLKRSREGQGELPPAAEDGRLLETCTWEMIRAERGTWDARVGLSELMRDSIFSASLLQASICKRKILSLENLRKGPVKQIPCTCQKENDYRDSFFSFCLYRAVGLSPGLHSLRTCKGTNGDQKLHVHCPSQSAMFGFAQCYSIHCLPLETVTTVRHSRREAFSTALQQGMETGLGRGSCNYSHSPFP